MPIDDPDCGLGKLDDDGLASVAEADPGTLAGDLDAAVAGKRGRLAAVAYIVQEVAAEGDRPALLICEEPD